MNSFKTITPVILLLGMGATACSPRVRQLGRDALPSLGAPKPDRSCRLALAGVRDARPPAERTGQGLREFRLFIPLPLFFVWWTNGVEVADPESLGGARLNGDLEGGIRALLSQSGPCTLVTDRAAATHTLEVELEHLYGLNGYYYFFAVSSGGAGSERANFYPSGHAAFRFVLRASPDGPEREFRLSAGRLFEPSTGGKDASDPDTGPDFDPGENRRTLQAVLALREVFRGLPAALDHALAELDVDTVEPFDPSRFTIVRQLDDLEHVERAVIDTATGRVLEVEIVKRDFQLVSAPGEWVVSPYQPGALTARAYQRLLAHLGERFVVEYRDNLSAARFGGVRDAPRGEQSAILSRGAR